MIRTIDVREISKNIKEITKVDLDEILASHSTEWVYIGRPLR